MANEIIKFDATAAVAALERVDKACKGGLRPAAQAGAQVAYDEAKRKVSLIGKVTGNLDQAIYQAFSPENSDPNKATYHVSWNWRKAPHGQLVEYGHIQSYKVYVGKNGRWYTSKTKLDAPKRVGAQSFIRTTYDQKAQTIGEAMQDRLEEEFNRGV